MITERMIQITQSDMEKLQRLVAGRSNSATRDQKNLEMLADELERAEVLPGQTIAADAVTMHSHVLVRDLDSRVESSYTLVFPSDANIAEGKISILAPIAIALLGYREGDEIEWPTPGGRRRLKIVRVLYQPEAAGQGSGSAMATFQQSQSSDERSDGSSLVAS